MTSILRTLYLGYPADLYFEDGVLGLSIQLTSILRTLYLGYPVISVSRTLYLGYPADIYFEDVATWVIQ
jgi:hypothetical protein